MSTKLYSLAELRDAIISLIEADREVAKSAVFFDNNCSTLEAWDGSIRNEKGSRDSCPFVSFRVNEDIWPNGIDHFKYAGRKDKLPTRIQ